jgi:pSer/pThr/pTyr-binding forkhead associated (FHA) protein
MKDNSVMKVEKFPFLIGKSNTAALRIKVPSVSRFHAKITLEGEEASIMDLGSTNGTYLNKIKILEHKPYLIGPDDELLFAGVGYIWRVL